MWFSMWAALSIASFGVAWSPMIYYLIKRRNEHFIRQRKLEALILGRLKKENPGMSVVDSQKDSLGKSRNAYVWTIASLLIFPAFYVFYFLKKDLREHEMHEHDFLAEVTELAKKSETSLSLHGFAETPSFPLKKYLMISVGTLGLAAAYWLYRIFNDYNLHFKMQWKNEDALLSFLKSLDEKSG